MSPDATRDDLPLAGALAPWLDAAAGGVVLAVSGGPDSTALLHAAARAGRGTPIAVATIDHGLRPESAAEAAAVGAFARRLGLPHTTLRWQSPRRTGLQAAARAARYRLLADHACTVGAGLVLTAHTRDDQAETVLMRLFAGSGPAGLAGMRRDRALGEGVRLARPFLDLPKADLVAYCRRHGLPFVQDPSNADARFARARLRALMPHLAAEGLDAARLCRLAERLARDEAALAGAAAILLREARVPTLPDTVALDGARLRAAPDAVVLRAIDTGIETLQPEVERAVPRRLARLERLVFDALLPALAQGRPLRRTLRGVAVEVTRSGLLRLTPAPARRSAPCDRPDGATDRDDVRHAAGGGDLLGKAEGAAYIGRECPE